MGQKMKGSISVPPRASAKRNVKDPPKKQAKAASTRKTRVRAEARPKSKLPGETAVKTTEKSEVVQQPGSERTSEGTRTTEDDTAQEEQEENEKALCSVAYRGRAHRVGELLTQGKVSLEGKQRALSEAVRGGHIDIVEILVDDGASLRCAVLERGIQALFHNAVSRGHSEIVDLLLSNGAVIETSGGADYRGLTVLQCAAEKGHTETVDLLLKNGASIDAQSENQGRKTALHLAAHKGHSDTVQLLVDKGASLEAKDIDGCTALDWAKGNCHYEIEKILKRALKLESVAKSSPCFPLSPELLK